MSSAALALALVAAAGCGSAGRGGPPPSREIAFGSVAPPTEAQCGFADRSALRQSATRTAAGGSRAMPRPGAYDYATAGWQSDPDVPGGRAPLPARSTAVVTRARDALGLACFGRTQRFSDETLTSDVSVIRGGDVYLVGIGVTTPHLIDRLLPRPAILAVSDAETSWAGRFSGATEGGYRVTFLGRRVFHLGARRVSAFGLDTRAVYHGEVEGWRRARTWLTAGRGLVVAESGRSAIRVGGATERLVYRTHLLSLQPRSPKDNA